MERYEARHLLKAMKDDGWYLGDTDGPCRQYVHRTRPEIVTVCLRHTDELGPGARESAHGPRRTDPDVEASIVVEATATGFCAHSPELPGCVASAGSEEEVRERMAVAVALHRSGLRSGR